MAKLALSGMTPILWKSPPCFPPFPLWLGGSHRKLPACTWDHRQWLALRNKALQTSKLVDSLSQSPGKEKVEIKQPGSPSFHGPPGLPFT